MHSRQTARPRRTVAGSTRWSGLVASTWRVLLIPQYRFRSGLYSTNTPASTWMYLDRDVDFQPGCRSGQGVQIKMGSERQARISAHLTAVEIGSWFLLQGRPHHLVSARHRSMRPSHEGEHPIRRMYGASPAATDRRCEPTWLRPTPRAVRL